MDAKKKPSMFTAILFTVAAVCSLMTCLLLLTRGSRGGGLIAFGLLTSALLVVSAIGNWVSYFRKWVDFEIERRRESTTTKE
ncbi:MAG: hypothetical protein M1376_16120 [Planctomycetes bacterium]|nr:hypothetical protein [Planctomycetota bacterium]